MVTESHIACPRCQSRDVAASECSNCGGLNRVTCRSCSHDGCRDLLCELRSHDRAFRRRLLTMVALMAAMVAALVGYGGQLKQITVARLPERPSATAPAVDESAIAWNASPSPEPSAQPVVVPSVPSVVPEPPRVVEVPPTVAPVAAPSASARPSPIPGPREGGWVEVTPGKPFASPSVTASVVPGVASADPGDGPGFWVQDIDEDELRSGRLAASERGPRPRTSRPVELAAEEIPAPQLGAPAVPWGQRLVSVMKEALAARYSPSGTTLRTGLSPGGLVHWVFRRMGVRNVPEFVEDQMEMGERVEPRGYRPRVGDLLFFKIGRLNHVGIYFDGDQNTFLTVVPSKGGVVVADWEHKFFRSRFLFARRITPSR